MKKIAYLTLSLLCAATAMASDPLDPREMEARITRLEQEVARLRAPERKAEGIVPVMTKIYNTATTCEGVTRTIRVAQTNYPIAFLKEMVCDDVTYSVVQTLPAESDMPFGMVWTIRKDQIVPLFSR